VKTYVIDTNALISFVTDRNFRQQGKIAGLLDEAARLKCTIICPQNALTEFVYVLDKVYGTEKRKIRLMIKDFIALPGVKVVNDVDFELVLKYWPKPLPDYGDAIVASVCRAHQGAVVVTFDRKLINALKKLNIDVAIL
jgi:predicted nucleic-acid-binding protein